MDAHLRSFRFGQLQAVSFLLFFNAEALRSIFPIFQLILSYISIDFVVSFN